ncbi:o-succinylbenzoate synthase [Austwickia sp. TVS 96-490-7B]|uniref:o-succinylbenzoate synthase n=1 Tax=Austwickia sp. TVS 96-490-7B TaxID=2830843 RepID=UPI001C58FA59|nr:o-succinylbenzoate synthase [Austwickia sp. TVS 96-490-7B]
MRDLPWDDVIGAATVVRLPMRVRFRGVESREAVLLPGPCGWGEFAPFPEYDDAEASRWLAAAADAAYRPMPPPMRDTVRVNATLPAVPVADVEHVLTRFPGCDTVKVKVAERGQHLDHDVARLAEVRALWGPSARVRIDANGGWSLTEAREALARLSRFDLEYAEQPCRTVEELAELRLALARDGVDVPIAADESIRKAADPLRVRDLEAADVIVVKVAPLGGIRAALRIVQECGLPAVVSSALDTSVGIAAGVALAAALPRLDYACGLGTVALLAADVSPKPLLPDHGQLQVRPAVIDPDRLTQWAVEPERSRWWLERLRRCHAHLMRP